MKICGPRALKAGSWGSLAPTCGTLQGQSHANMLDSGGMEVLLRRTSHLHGASGASVLDQFESFTLLPERDLLNGSR